jgi:hypothetical protein
MKKLKSTSLESAKSTKKSYAPLTPGKGYSASSTGWRDLTIEGHKYALRQNTAYSGLRNYLSITAWLTAIGFAILGLVLLSENNKGIGVSLLIAGPLLAAFPTKYPWVPIPMAMITLHIMIVIPFFIQAG